MEHQHFNAIIGNGIDLIHAQPPSRLPRLELQSVFRSLLDPISNAKWVEPEPGACPCRCSGTLARCARPNQPFTGPENTPARKLDDMSTGVEQIRRCTENDLLRDLSPPRCLSREIRPPTPVLKPNGFPLTPSDASSWKPEEGPTPLNQYRIYDENSPGYIRRKAWWGTPLEMARLKREAARQKLADRHHGKSRHKRNKQKTEKQKPYRETIGTRSHRILWHVELDFAGRSSFPSRIVPF